MTANDKKAKASMSAMLRQASTRRVRSRAKVVDFTLFRICQRRFIPNGTMKSNTREKGMKPVKTVITL